MEAVRPSNRLTSHTHRTELTCIHKTATYYTLHVQCTHRVYHQYAATLCVRKQRYHEYPTGLS